MSVIGSNIIAGASGGGAGGYKIERSLKFNSGDSAHLSKSFGSAGNRKTWTWSGWVKRSAIGTKQIFFGVQGTSDTTYVENYFATDDKLYLRYGYNSVAEVRTTQVFRDTASWMHIVIVFNVTESADADKLKLYINGSQVTDFSTDTRSSFSNQDYGINRDGLHKISGAPNGSGDLLDAYLADVHFIDGQALAATDFGEADDNGAWQPKKFAGTYGTNGFYLKFNESTLGTDTSGNNNHWESHNLIANAESIPLGTITNANALASSTVLTFPDSTNFDKYSQGDVVGIKNSPGIVSYVGSISHTAGLNVHNLLNATGGKAYAAKQANCGNTPAAACDGNPNNYRTHGVCAVGSPINYMECAYFSGVPIDQFIQFNATGFRPNILKVDDWNAVSIPVTTENVRIITITYHNTSNTTTVNNYVNGTNITLLDHDIYRITLQGKLNGYDKNGGNVLEFSMLFDGKPLSADANGVRGTTINTIDASINKITTAGGIWYGTDGSGTSGDGRYEPAQQWSNQVIGNVEGFYGTIIQNIFNGTISTGTSGGITPKSGESLVLNFGSDLSSAQNVTIYGYSAGATAGSGVLKINDVDVLFSSSTGDNNTTFNLSNGLQKIEWGNVSASAYIYVQGIKVDGVFLKDFDITGGRGNTTISKLASTSGDNFVDSPANGTASTGSDPGGVTVGNYATLNPLTLPGGGTLSDGNLKYSSGGGWDPTSATIGVNSGKWYWEYLFEGTNMECGITAHPNTDNFIGNYQGSVGIGNGAEKYLNGTSSNPSGWSTIATGSIIGNELDLDTGTFRHYVNGVVAPSYATQSLDTSLTWFPAGSVYGSSHLTYNFGQRPFVYQNAGTNRPSADFKCLCTANLPEPTIADGSQYFDTKLYDGSANARSLTMDNSSLSPDFVWIKSRSAGSAHHLFDIIRGPGKRLISNGTQDDSYDASDSLTSFDSNGFSLGADSTTGCVNNPSGATYSAWAWDAGANSNKTYAITVANPGSGNKYYADGAQQPTLTLAEGSTYKFDQSDSSNTTHRLRFSTTSDGTHANPAGTEYTTGVTTVGTPGSAGAYTQIVIAASAPTLYAYCENHPGMGFQVNTSDKGGATNLDGTIPSQVMASPESGFSIISYTATGNDASIGHGLSAAPAFFFGRNRDDTSGNLDWIIYHQAMGNTARLKFNLNSESTSSTFFQDTSPSSSVISIGTSNDINKSGDDYIIYAFSEVANYSSMGSYLGNGSDDGPFVYTGFKPRVIFTKAYSSNSHNNNNWSIHDTSRDPFNEASEILAPNNPNITLDNAHTGIDILSNGFKLKADTNGQCNYNGWNYLYFAIAENPFASNGGLAR